MENLIKDIKQSLEEFAEEKRIEFAKKSYPTKTFNSKDKLDLIKRLVDQDIFELQQIAFEYLQSQKNLYKSLTEEYIESIEKNLDNWVSVDYFGAIVVGCAWRENFVSIEKVKNYLKSDNYWIRRIAIVATVSLNQKARGGFGDSKRTLEICRLVVDDHEEMIIKALSWALRELVKIEKEPVIKFVNEFENRLHKKVLREVKNKLETGLKN